MTDPFSSWAQLMHAVSLEDSEKAVLFIATKPSLAEFANKFSDQIFELHDERQLLAGVNCEIVRLEIEAICQREIRVC